MAASLGAAARTETEPMPPMSRGTDYSDWTNHAIGTAASTDFDQSMPVNRTQESLQHLQERPDPVPPLPTNPQNLSRSPILPETHDKSPTFMSTFKRSSKQSANGAAVPNGHANGFANGHSRLPSEPFAHADAVAEKRKEVQKHLGQNHEYFTGNTVFCWGGRWQNARARPVVIITGLIILVPSVLFFIFSASWLWHHSSPALPIIYAYIFYICMSSFIHASVSNPGILPRNLHTQQLPDVNTDPLAVQSANRWTLVKSPTSKFGLFEIPTKYCSTCNIWRPPRCHHCRVCDNCIETQDHHCVWLNNCVGRRNYRYFFAFISSSALLALYLLGVSIGHVAAWAKVNRTSFATSINHNRVPFAMFIYGILAFGYPLSLLGYHLFLIVRGQTTHEFLNATRFRDLDRHRPFDQTSWWKNLAIVLVRPRPPTYLNFKARYEEGDQRFGERRGHRTTPLTAAQQGGGGIVELQRLEQPGPPSFRGPRSRMRGAVDATPR